MRHTRGYQLSFLSYLLASLEMRHTRVLGAGSQPMLAYLFEDATFSAPPNLHTSISLVENYRFAQCSA